LYIIIVCVNFSVKHALKFLDDVSAMTFYWRGDGRSVEVNEASCWGVVGKGQRFG